MMNNICKITIETIKSFLFKNKDIDITEIKNMPPLFFHFEFDYKDKDIHYKLYEPFEIFVDIDKWGSYTKDYFKLSKNTGCAIIAITEDVDDNPANLYFTFTVYNNNGEINSFKCLADNILDEEVKYEWFDIQEFCPDFGMMHH